MQADGAEERTAIDFGALGRQIDDRMLTLGDQADGASRRISTTYDVRGSVARVATHDDPAAGMSNVVNELVFECNDRGSRKRGRVTLSLMSLPLTVLQFADLIRPCQDANESPQGEPCSTY